MVMTGEWILALFYPHHNIIHTERPFLKVNLSHLMVKQTGGRETWVHRLQAAVEGEIVPFEQPWGSGTDPWNMDCAVEGKFHILVVSKWKNFVELVWIGQNSGDHRQTNMATPNHSFSLWFHTKPMILASDPTVPAGDRSPRGRTQFQLGRCYFHLRQMSWNMGCNEIIPLYIYIVVSIYIYIYSCIYLCIYI